MDGVAFGRSRSDCAPAQLDLLSAFVTDTRSVFGDIVEIGSWRCGASVMMAAANPKKWVRAFDLFGGLPYGEGKGFENFADTDWEEIQEAATPYKNLQLIRGLHEVTIPEFAKQRRALSLIFMDSDHYSSHQVALSQLGPLLSSGGVIVFHDWTFDGVQQAVKELISPDEYNFCGGREWLNMGVARKK